MSQSSGGVFVSGALYVNTARLGSTSQPIGKNPLLRFKHTEGDFFVFFDPWVKGRNVWRVDDVEHFRPVQASDMLYSWPEELEAAEAQMRANTCSPQASDEHQTERSDA